MSTTATATLPAATAATDKHRRGFSFTSKSSKSRRSSANSGNTSNPVTPIAETAEDKARRSLQSKADPTMALSELQPSELGFFFFFFFIILILVYIVTDILVFSGGRSRKVEPGKYSRNAAQGSIRECYQYVGSLPPFDFI